ncbi:MAG: hypothetical protein M5R42_14570 [Rhodocyclaceae bacterium]|nr:hypothetical protein [Rhodocyclaceae bacterium]
MDNYYLDTWSGSLNHPSGNSTGHLDMDNAIQNATANPNRPGVGGIGFDNNGTYSGSESGDLGFREAGVIGLAGSLSGCDLPRKLFTKPTQQRQLGGNALQGEQATSGEHCCRQQQPAAQLDGDCCGAGAYRRLPQAVVNKAT